MGINLLAQYFLIGQAKINLDQRLTQQGVHTSANIWSHQALIQTLNKPKIGWHETDNELRNKLLSTTLNLQV